MTTPTASTSSPDVIIIGTGQAGVPLATRLAAAGKRVLLAERSHLGGTCVNYGCTPTKTMIASARAAHVARTGGRLGVHADGVRVDFPEVVRRKDAIVNRWRDGIEARLRRAGEGLRVVRGHARFVGPREIEVAGVRQRAETIIVNVGTRPAIPALPGLDSVPWLDNRRAMDLAELPRHLIVLGGGYVGCEFAQMFRRFGCEVTVIQRQPRLLGRGEPEATGELEKAFHSEEIRVLLSTQAHSVAKSNDGLVVHLSDGSEVRGSHLLVAVGRTPNTDDLGCDVAGVKIDARGFISVDDAYRTSAPGVCAVGDVTGGPQYTNAAWDDHRLLFDLLLSRARPGSPRGRSARLVPSTVFTDPQVAAVGMTEQEARAMGIVHEVATMSFGAIARSIEVDETAGVLKVIIDPATERILGATIVGAEAGELIHVFVCLMQAGASARAIVDSEMVHPTFAEGVQSVVMKLKRYALS